MTTICNHCFSWFLNWKKIQCHVISYPCTFLDIHWLFSIKIQHYNFCNENKLTTEDKKNDICRYVCVHIFRCYMIHLNGAGLLGCAWYAIVLWLPYTINIWRKMLYLFLKSKFPRLNLFHWSVIESHRCINLGIEITLINIFMLYFRCNGFRSL